MKSFARNAEMLGSAVVLATSSGGAATPVWREAFQSSPAAYERPSEEVVKVVAEQTKAPVDQVRAGMGPQPVDGTVRYRVTVSAAGSQIRIRLSNEEGTAPVRLGAASVGLAAQGFSARARSLKQLTFAGIRSATIAPGSPLISDPVSIAVQPGTQLLVSASLAAPMENESRGGATFVLAHGDQAMRTRLGKAQKLTGRPLISGVSVLSEAPLHVIVALGDSITDGNRTSLTALRGWPEELAHRLALRRNAGSYAVVNAGIAGNRLLKAGWGSAALSRLDRDALRIEGVSHLILLEGINDIGMAGNGPFGANPEITADDLIAGYREVIGRAHSQGIKVYLGTLTPNAGSAAYSSPVKDHMREAVNHWIRTSGEPDAVIDFDEMVRDPVAPRRFRPEYDSGDHLHPSDAGYMAMGAGIDLALFP